MFDHIDVYGGDPILGLMEAYNNDNRNEKVNLSIGLYYDENGKVPFLKSVHKAKVALQSQPEKPCVYLPMSGLPSYCNEVRQLIFGADREVVKTGKVVTVQTLGGSGALKTGGDFLHKWYPQSKVYVSNPTWENHIAIFEGSGFQVGKYPYYNPETSGVDFEAMIAFLQSLQPKDIVLLHPCCHNPTGADLTNEQWDRVIEVVKEKDLIPFLDMAYQGFGRGFAEDAYAIHAMADAGLEFLLSNSFSKIFSLYGERVGGLSVVCKTKETADKVLGQLKFTIRKTYSNPPTTGAEWVNGVLTTAELKKEWFEELENMRQRMAKVRQGLYDTIIHLGGKAEKYQYLKQQTGMFSYSGLSPKQVDALKDDYAIYIVKSGRICIAGLNDQNMEKVAKAFLAVESV